MKNKLLFLLLTSCLLTGCGENSEQIQDESGNVTENSSNVDANKEEKNSEEKTAENQSQESEQQTEGNNGETQDGEDENANEGENQSGEGQSQEGEQQTEGNNGETQEGEQQTEGNNGETQEGEQQTEGGEDSENEELIETYSAYFKTTGTTFEQNFTARAELRNSGNLQNNVNALENYIRTYLDDGANQLTKLTFNGFVQTLDAEGGLYISLGSSSSDGSMTWYSNKKILKVEVTVKNYYKTYSYGTVSGVSVDNLAHFLIDETDYSLELTENIAPESKTFSVNYDNGGVNSFTVSSKDGRVLLESFTITWAK